MAIRETWGLCKECYGIVAARTDGEVIGKVCPVHGYQEAVIDPEPGFYERVAAMPYKDWKRLPHTSISVTDRCNLRCPGCYARPDSTPDQSIEDIMKVVRVAKNPGIGLMGSEPTMRDDLAEIIRQIKIEFPQKPVSIYTNGIRLTDAKYLEGLIEAGITRICLSLHLPNYVGEKAFGEKIHAIHNIVSTGLPLLDHVAFSLKTVDEMEAALRYIVAFDYKQLSGNYVRLRAPAEMGGDRNVPTSMSAMLHAAYRACERLGYSIQVMPYTNHIYAVRLIVQGKQILIVRWPTVEEMDLVELQKGPRSALFVPQIGETQIIHQGMITERVRSGHALPPPPPVECPAHISGRIEHGAAG